MDANNMVAMREALVWLSKTGHRTPEGGWMCITLKMNQKDGKPYPIEVPPYAEDVITAALAKPPRNCDMGTPEEQEKRWHKNCGHGIPNCKHCKVYAQAKESGLVDDRGFLRCSCEFIWAQMPYKAEEGGTI